MSSCLVLSAYQLKIYIYYISGVSAGVSGEEEKIREGQEVTTGEHCLQLAPVNTDTKPWAEVIEMNWQTNLVRDDLIVLRDFFKQGMNISVIEQVVS